MLHSHASPNMLLTERKVAASQWFEYVDIAAVPEIVTQEVAINSSVMYYYKIMMVLTYYMCLSILFSSNKQPIHRRPDGQSKRRGSPGRSRDAP